MGQTKRHPGTATPSCQFVFVDLAGCGSAVDAGAANDARVKLQDMGLHVAAWGRDELIEKLGITLEPLTHDPL
jgi:hypothetical protein